MVDWPTTHDVLLHYETCLVVEYDIDITENLLSIYKEKNEDMFNFLNKKSLNKKLNEVIIENKKGVINKI